MAKNGTKQEEKEVVESEIAVPEFTGSVDLTLIQKASSIDEIAPVEKFTPKGVNKTDGENFTILDAVFGTNTYEGEEHENVYMKVINERTKEDEVLVTSSVLIVRQLQRVAALNKFPVRGYFQQNPDKRNRWELLAPREMGDTPF